MHTASPLRTVGVDVVATADGPPSDLVARVEAATRGTAFRVFDAVVDGPRARIRFVADGLAVGWGTILDLQHRLLRAVEVVAVERLTEADLCPDLVDV